MDKCVLALLLVTSLSSGQLQSKYTCLRDDCGRYDVPAKRERVCRQYVSQTGELEVEWYAGSLASPDYACTRSSTASEVLTFCPGYVGMSMGLLCDFDGEIVIYKDGAPLTGGSNVTYSSLQREHEGLYQCVNGSNEVVGEFNMTVRSEIHMGNDDTCNPFFCHNFRCEKCCSREWRPFPTFNYRQGNPYRLIVYGDEPIEITHNTEWVTNDTVHYPTDLGVFVTRDKNDSRVLNINFYYTPYSVNGDDLEIDLRITASNNFSSFSMCLRIEFTGYFMFGMNANTSLPLAVNATVGEDVVFMCEFGAAADLIATPRLHFELSMPKDYNGNVTQIRTTCTQWTNCDPWTPTNRSIRVSIQPKRISSVPSTAQYRYGVSLTEVAPYLHGTVFSCSISTLQMGPPNLDAQDVLQWKGSAQLSVQKTPTEPETSQKFAAPVSVIVIITVTLLLATAVVVILLLAAAIIWRKRHYINSKPSDTIPLADQSQQGISDSRSTLNSEEGTDVATVPSVETDGSTKSFKQLPEEMENYLQRR